MEVRRGLRAPDSDMEFAGDRSRCLLCEDGRCTMTAVHLNANMAPYIKFLGILAIATVLGLVPYVLPSLLGITSLPSLALLTVLLGVTAGALSRYMVLPGALLSCFIAVCVARKTGFVGNTGDGQLWYLLALFYCITFAVSDLLTTIAISISKFVARKRQSQ